MKITKVYYCILPTTEKVVPRSTPMVVARPLNPIAAIIAQIATAMVIIVMKYDMLILKIVLK